MHFGLSRSLVDAGLPTWCFTNRYLQSQTSVDKGILVGKMKKILSIDSGGIRGIIPALILAELEARTGQPVSELFDLFVGTSTGGMLVLGLNCPAQSSGLDPRCSAAQVAQLFHQWGSRVFGSSIPKGSLSLTQRTSEKRIEETFREYFGSALLSESIRPTLVTAFDLMAGRPFFFNSEKTYRNSEPDVFMWQAARATTALPSHFEPLHLCRNIRANIQMGLAIRPLAIAAPGECKLCVKLQELLFWDSNLGGRICGECKPFLEAAEVVLVANGCAHPADTLIFRNP